LLPGKGLEKFPRRKVRMEIKQGGNPPGKNGKTGPNTPALKGNPPGNNCPVRGSKVPKW